MDVLNGSLVTTTSTEVELIPKVLDDDGTLKLAGRDIFFFVLVTGSVKTSVGNVIDANGFTHASHSVVDDKWFHTASPETTVNGAENIRAKGVATFIMYW